MTDATLRLRLRRFRPAVEHAVEHHVWLARLVLKCCLQNPHSTVRACSCCRRSRRVPFATVQWHLSEQLRALEC
ncbi:MAG: hypothetical protein ACO307_16895, partial [Ilumatobacteraceae bacterium]